jgi:hypothetical protein
VVGRLTAVGTTPAGGASHRAVQVPVYVSFEGEQVCVQGWSTDLTYSYTGHSSNTHGVGFQEGHANLASPTFDGGRHYLASADSVVYAFEVAPYLGAPIGAGKTVGPSGTITGRRLTDGAA